MKTQTKRRSRWHDPPPVNFRETDLPICELLVPGVQIRRPWGYGYLPKSYFGALLNRGPKGTANRVVELTGKPHYLELAEQDETNNHQLIYRLARAGEEEVSAAAGGLKIKRSSRPVPHELMACVIAASFEMGAREASLPITIHPKLSLSVFPDWPIFDFHGQTVFIEADTSSMTIRANAESEGASIRLKYEHYLKLLQERKLDSKTRFIFYVPNEHRCHSFVEALKYTIDKYDYPHEYAEQFCFTWFKYNRFLKHIPELSSWTTTQQYLRAGHKPFTFLKGK